MKLSYRVTREQYTDLIAMSMRERAMKPAQLVLTAVMCGLPVVLVLALLVTGGLRGMQMLLLSAAALALAAANLALRTRYHGRARRELERMLESGRVDKRFFDQQTLVLNDRGIVLSYPGISTRYDWTDYTGLIERRDAILLYFGGEPAAIVPLSAFDGEDERKAFLSAMDASVRAVLIADTREKREDIPAHPFSILHYSYDLATYLRHQREARRAALLQVNVNGTGEMIALAQKAKIPLYHISTTSVAGNIPKENRLYSPCLQENQLDIGQDWHSNIYVRSKFLAEKAVNLRLDTKRLSNYVVYFTY